MKREDKTWQKFFKKNMKNYWSEEAAKVAEKIPCKDEELKRALAVNMSYIVNSLNAPIPDFNNKTLREFLSTDKGIEYYKDMVMSVPDGSSTCPRPFYVRNEQYWKTYYEWIIQFFSKEHKSIAERIPCNDTEVRDAIAVAMPDIFEKLEKKHPPFENRLGKDILNTEFGPMHYKYLLISQDDGLDKFPVKLDAPEEKKWNNYYEKRITAWSEYHEKFSKNIPCIDNELKKMLAIGRYDIVESLDNPVRCFENRLMRDVLMTNSGINHFKSLIMHLPFGFIIH